VTEPRSSSGAKETPSAAPRRLFKNLNGYLGETIDFPSVLRDCVEAAARYGWTVSQIPVDEQLSLPVFTRPGPLVTDSAPTQPIPRVYVSAGIHGDEPAGPLAVRRLLQNDCWPRGIGLWLCPCLNPSGFRLNRRENAQGLDLNRQYLDPKAAETAAHIRWLEAQPEFDLCLCLHEDWEAHGFYVYELNPSGKPSQAESIVEAVKGVCPIDTSELIEGRPARSGIIRPSVDPRDRPQWPESFYLLTHQTKLSYTLEAPSDFDLSCRVAALELAVMTSLRLVETD
jgi:murein peptide amidase A